MRKYMALVQYEKDRMEIPFLSSYTLNSRANRADCRLELRKMLGRKADRAEILEICRSEKQVQ